MQNFMMVQWILHAAEMSAASRDNNTRDNSTAGSEHCWQRTFLRRAESMQKSLHHHKILHIF